MKTVKEMRELVLSGKAKVLKFAEKDELKGKKITTFYFGYNGQDVVDEFVVGQIKTLWVLASEDYNVLGHANRLDYWKSYMDDKDLREVKGTFEILTEDGRRTNIRYNVLRDLTYIGAFYCSDADREVYYILNED